MKAGNSGANTGRRFQDLSHPHSSFLDPTALEALFETKRFVGIRHFL